MTPEITVEQTTDEAYIKSVLLNPSIYEQMRDDSCPKEPTVLGCVDIKAIPGFFLKAAVNGTGAGLWWLIWKGQSVEAHTALLDNCRGRYAIRATKAAIRWVFEHTGAKAITSYAWSDSPAVAWFCRAVGMHETGVEVWSATRNGSSVNITHFIINRQEAT